jgi:hypothetical protein
MWVDNKGEDGVRKSSNSNIAFEHGDQRAEVNRNVRWYQSKKCLVLVACERRHERDGGGKGKREGRNGKKACQTIGRRQRSINRCLKSGVLREK